MSLITLSSLLLLVAIPDANGHRVRSGETWKPSSRIDAPGVNGVVLLAGIVKRAQIGPARISGAYRAIETSRNAVLTNIRVEGLQATDLERDGIRLRGDANNVTIRNFALRMRSRPQVSPHLPEGIALMSGSNITISDGSIRGFRMVPKGQRYTNGDGIAAERQVRDLSISRVEASDNSDAGFDLKSRGTRLNQLVAARNHRNYRFWDQVTAGTLTSIDPRNAHVWISKAGRVRIDRFVARSGNRVPLIRIEAGGRVEIGRCDLSLPPGTRIIAGDRSQVHLGPGCRS